MWEQRLLSHVPALTTRGEAIEVVDPGRRNPQCRARLFQRQGAHRRPAVGRQRRDAPASKRLDGARTLGRQSLRLGGAARRGRSRYRGVPLQRRSGTAMGRAHSAGVAGRLRLSHLTERLAALPRTDTRASAALPSPTGSPALALERLQQKSGRIDDLLTQHQGNWEEVCYITLARSMGFGVNGDAFERLARSLPLLFLQKHADSLLQVEAFLFGQAGLLDREKGWADPYASRLSREYDFLRHKFSLTPIDPTAWKFMRLRPRQPSPPAHRPAGTVQFTGGSTSLPACSNATARKPYSRSSTFTSKTIGTRTTLSAWSLRPASRHWDGVPCGCSSSTAWRRCSMPTRCARAMPRMPTVPCGCSKSSRPKTITSCAG